MRKLKAIIIGCGGRGATYSKQMLASPDLFEVVGIAEPLKERRELIQKRHGLKDEMCFDDYKPLFELGKIADFAVISTMDRDHFEPAMRAIELGYDLLLEKPIAPTANECAHLTDEAVKRGVKVIVCTVLRYTPLFMTLKHLIDSGAVGDVVSINHEECVGDVHQSHSFVRGNWGNEGRSSSMLLQKSCHDIDILGWLIGKRCKKVQSFSSRVYFRKENAPVGAPEYCIEGCPHSDKCPYDAVKLYLKNEDKGYRNWFRTASTRLPAPTDEDVEKTIRTTQYGKCVFKCDNDVVDHQTVNMLYEDDITVTFTMCAFTRGGRYMHIMGTKGEIHAVLDGDQPIKLMNFETRKRTEIPSSGVDGIVGGHGGGDSGIVAALYDYLCGEYKGSSVPEIGESAYNHLVTFAAEKARETGTIVDVDEFIKEVCMG